MCMTIPMHAKRPLGKLLASLLWKMQMDGEWSLPSTLSPVCGIGKIGSGAQCLNFEFSGEPRHHLNLRFLCRELSLAKEEESWKEQHSD